MSARDYPCSSPKCEIKSALSIPGVSVLPDEQKEIIISMNDYVTVCQKNPAPLVTFGVADCVVVALYNPHHGRYLTHILRDVNNNRNSVSNVCDLPDICFECKSNEDKACVDEMYKSAWNCNEISGCRPCNLLDNTASFQESLPSWVRCPDTQAVLFSLGEKYKLYSRYKQLKQNGFAGKATLYMAPNKLQGQLLEQFREIYQDSAEKEIEKYKSQDEAFFTNNNLGKWYNTWKNTPYNSEAKKDGSIIDGSGGVILFDSEGQLRHFVHDEPSWYLNQYRNTYSENDSKGWHCPYLLTSNYRQE